MFYLFITGRFCFFRLHLKFSVLIRNMGSKLVFRFSLYSQKIGYIFGLFCSEVASTSAGLSIGRAYVGHSLFLAAIRWQHSKCFLLDRFRMSILLLK